MVAFGALTWKIEPPLKSTLKFSPRMSSATMAMTRMQPEIVYQSFCRPTKLIETSPAVQAAADVTEARHHASLEVVVRGVRVTPGAAGARARRGTPERHGARAPSRAGSRPDHLCP